MFSLEVAPAPLHCLGYRLSVLVDIEHHHHHSTNQLLSDNFLTLFHKFSNVLVRLLHGIKLHFVMAFSCFTQVAHKKARRKSHFQDRTEILISDEHRRHKYEAKNSDFILQNMHLFVVEIEVVQWEGAVDKKLAGNKTKPSPREGGRVSI